MYDGPVAVSIIDITDGNHDVVLDGVYSAQYDIQSFDPVMQYGSDYRVIIRADDEEVWNQTISRAEGYEVLVRMNGSVSVLGHGGV